ncbi:DUF6194 family protein [Actinophytocola sp. NPDC049390]|uniref:DUF6194 family protein n=1 Tax=Actinophytocola sp. NPDC049390 TaxID=3363894 RepID=UPI0037921A7E
MTVDELKKYFRDTFTGIRMDEAQGDTFVTYDPDGDLPADRWLPFATIVTSDNHETVSDLNHPNTYRLNIGLTTKTYASLFGPAPTTRDANGILDTGHDHATRDRLLPHPVYANHHWACVINPTQTTFDTVRPLLADAYDFAVRKHNNSASRAPEHRESRARTP